MRGRPPKEFSRAPDRHLMALAVAYWALGASKRGGCEIAVATVEGWPVGRNRQRDKGGHGLNLLDWDYDLKTKWCGAATIAGRARGLRQKIEKALKDSGAAAWLQEMGELFLLALRQGAMRDRTVEDEIKRRAKALGETEFARERLLPLHALTRQRRMIYSPQM
jgi:hypothetical protein